jgi:hypothetical protein
LTGEEFYNMTPRQLDALTRRYQRRMEREQLLFAQLISYVINFSHPRSRPVEPVHARDFMPSEWSKRQQAAPKRINRKEAAESIRRLFAPLIAH